MTYSRREVPVLIPIEHKLMKELGYDRSELHKVAIKEFYNRRQQSSLNLVWGRNEDSKDPTSSIRNACGNGKEVADETRWSCCETDWRELQQQN